MNMNGQKKKPTGVIGSITIHPDGRPPEFKQVGFPQGKAEIERYILKLTILNAKKIGLNPYDLKGEPIQNPEDSFDFTLPSTQGNQYLDLMEIASLEKVRGSHEQAPNHYNNGELADSIYSKILSKAKKYGQSPRSTIHLLLYTTDWKFKADEGVLDLLAYWSLRGQHCFKSILYFRPVSSNDGDVIVIYPRPVETFQQFDEARQRRRCTLSINIREGWISPPGPVTVSLDSNQEDS
jgi:hypothetical protein